MSKQCTMCLEQKLLSCFGLCGWLCKSCNHAIGLFSDNLDIVNKAAKYLKDHA